MAKRKTTSRTKRKGAGTRRTSYQNKRRKGLLSVFLPWVKRFGIVMAMLTGIIWITAWFFLSDADTRSYHWVENKILLASSNLGFSVQNILVEGRHHTDASILKAMININKDDPLFAFDPREAKIQIQKIAWIENVHIERRLPNTLYIELIERKPIALWQSEKTLKLIDSKGDVIPVTDLSPFKDLITVIGKDAPQQTAALMKALNASSDIEDWVEAAGLISGRRWDLVLDNGVRVKLPEDNSSQALSRLAEAQHENDILNKNLKSIDLRDPSRIVVRTKPGDVHDYSKANYQ